MSYGTYPCASFLTQALTSANVRRLMLYRALIKRFFAVLCQRTVLASVLVEKPR